MGRIVLLAALAFLAAVYFGIGLMVYRYFQQKNPAGVRRMDEAVNNQQRTDKMGIGEIATYSAMLIIAFLTILPILGRGGSGNAIIARMIILPVIMAVFNARKRTGKALFALAVACLFTVFFMMTYIIIGVPAKAPDCVLDGESIVMLKTTPSDLQKSGFEIVGDEMLGTNTYVLEKNGVELGKIYLWRGKEKTESPDTRKIERIDFDEENLTALRANGSSLKLNGVDLLAPLDNQVMEKKFKKKLWNTPKDAADQTDITQLWYGIAWRNNSDHLFWNEYFATMKIDESGNVWQIELNSASPADY